MALELESKEPRRMASLSVPPSRPLSAASSRSGGRSPSYSGLSFRGHCVNVILPETAPELEVIDTDIVQRVEGIKDFDEEDVSP